MFDRTIVGWDGSAPSDGAVEWAIERVSGRSDNLLIVRTVDDTALFTGEIEARWAVDVATLAIAELAATVRVAHPLLVVETLVVRGEPGDVLAEMSTPDSLIVVGSQNAPAADYQYSSRLGARLAAEAHGAVAIIPVGDDQARSGAVVGVDASDSALTPCLFAAELAGQRSMPLRVVRACSDHPARSGAGFNADAADREALSDLLAPVREAFPTLSVTAHIEHDPPATALLTHADTATFVVVGARRPGIVRRLFLGSVSQALVNKARCPLIIVAPQGGVSV